MKLAFLIAGATAVVAPSTVSRADDIAEAKDHYIKGTKAFELGAYDEAIAEYSTAYRLKDDPALLYNLAQSHRFANHPAEAARFYRLFLMKVPNAPNRSEVEDKIAELQKLIEQQKKTQNMPPDTVKGPASTAQPGGGAPAPSAASSTSAEQAPVVVSDTTSLRRTARTEKIAGAATAAVGVALIVGGIVTGVLAQQAGNKLTNINNAMQTFDYNQQQTGKTEQLLEGVFLGVGAAAVVAGGIVFLLGHREQRRAQRLSFAPVLGRAAIGATVEAGF